MSDGQQYWIIEWQGGLPKDPTWSIHSFHFVEAFARQELEATRGRYPTANARLVSATLGHSAAECDYEEARQILGAREHQTLVARIVELGLQGNLKRGET